MRDRKRLEEFISSDGRIRAMTDDLDTLFDLAREGESVADDIERDMKSYAELLDRIETALLLSGDKAECSAIVTTPAPEAPKARTGPRCSCACTSDGPSARASRPW
jgi:hypothetical protein